MGSRTTLPNNTKDITGQKFHHLTVISYAGSHPKFKLATWKCRCDCGRAAVVIGNSLRTNNTKSCGCLNNWAARRRRRTVVTARKKYHLERVRISPTKRIVKHRFVAEQALGHPLPKGAVVHHIDENRHNNAPSNLCVLASQAEHAALHRRLRVLKAGGNPWTQMICTRCKLPKDFAEFSPSVATRHNGQCRQCGLARTKQRKSTKAA